MQDHSRPRQRPWLEQVVLVVRAVLEVVGACEELEVFICSIGAYTMIGGPFRPRQRPWLEQLMLAWHLSWQLCLSFEHARQFGPLCPGSQSSMAVTGVVVGGPVVGDGVVLLVASGPT